MAASRDTLITDLRARFGLTQRVFAMWLGISPAQLARVEVGLDPLPRHAWPWLRPWGAALAAVPYPAPPTPVPTVPTGPPTLPSALAARLEFCHLQVFRLNQSIETAQARCATWEARLLAAPVLAAGLPPAADATEEAATALRRRWLARFAEEAADELLPQAPKGPPAVALLVARRAGLLAEAAALAAYAEPQAP